MNPADLFTKYSVSKLLVEQLQGGGVVKKLGLGRPQGLGVS